jgi:hypothetical protein
LSTANAVNLFSVFLSKTTQRKTRPQKSEGGGTKIKATT